MCKSFKCNKNVLFPLKRINGVFFRKINSKWFLYINEWIAGLQEGLIRNNAIKFRFSRLVQPWLVRARAGGERSWWRKSHCTEVRQRGNCNYTAGNWLEERDNNSLQIIGEKLSQVSALANVFHFSFSPLRHWGHLPRLSLAGSSNCSKRSRGCHLWRILPWRADPGPR